MVKAWAGRAANRAREQVRQRGFANDEPCCICDQPIDYRLPSTDDYGMTVQHIKPRSTHPHLTWDPANWSPAHSQCNKSAGNRTAQTLGTTSRQWGIG